MIRPFATTRSPSAVADGARHHDSAFEVEVGDVIAISEGWSIRTSRDPEGALSLGGSLWRVAGDRDGALGDARANRRGRVLPGVGTSSAIPTSIRSARPLTLVTSFAEPNERQREALDAFRAADGPQLLGCRTSDRRSSYNPRESARRDAVSCAHVSSCASRSTTATGRGITPSAARGAPRAREYNAIRNAAALIDVSPLFKIHRRRAGREHAGQSRHHRDVSRMSVGQVLHPVVRRARSRHRRRHGVEARGAALPLDGRRAQPQMVHAERAGARRHN